MKHTYIKIGTILKSHGTKGELKIQVDERYLQDFLRSEMVFIELQGSQVPFFKETPSSGQDKLLKLEDVDTKEAAGQLGRKALFLRQEDLTASADVAPDGFDVLVGYTVVDTAQGKIGAIQEMLELPQQWMAVVQTEQQQEVLIPINDTFIQEVDQEQRVLHMRLPEGLLKL